MCREPKKPGENTQHVSTLEWSILSILLLLVGWWINFGMQPKIFFICIFIWVALALWAGSLPIEVQDDE